MAKQVIAINLDQIRRLVLMMFIAAAIGGVLTNLVFQTSAQANPAKVLKDPPDLAYLPGYSGAPKYLSIASFASTSGAPCYLISFATADSMDTVLSWYQSTLRSLNWQICRSSAGSVLSARHGKTVLVVTVMPTTLKGYRSEVLLSHKMF